MRTITRSESTLLVVDLQARLMPAIAGGEAAIRETGRLIDAARLLGVPVVVTEQNPSGLGGTLPDLLPEGLVPFPKMHFDATREAGFLAHLGNRGDVVVVGCEAHVCVLQTVLGLLHGPYAVRLVQDAVASRTTANRDAALHRMARHGADLVTAEMVVFEWLGTADHVGFRDALRLVK